MQCNKLKAFMGTRRGLGGLPEGLRVLSGLVLLVVGCVETYAATHTNVVVANVTPSSFTVVWDAQPGSTPGIEVFADPSGVNTLAGQLRVELFPVHTGSPAAANRYEQRLSRAHLQDKTRGFGIQSVRVSGCDPDTTYYFRLSSTTLDGTTSYLPATPPLYAVHTAVENSFVAEAQQVIIDVPGLDVEGRVVMLTHTNAAFALAAVVGDGVGTNQVWFNLADLFALGGLQNFTPTGSQHFTAEVRGTGAEGGTVQEFDIEFTGAFDVAKATLISSQVELASLAIGSTIVLTGESNAVDLEFESTVGASTVSADLKLPDGYLTNLTLEPLVAGIDTATLTRTGQGQWRLELGTAPGQTLIGDQQIARLTFVAIPGATSAFVPLALSNVQALKPNGAPVATVLARSGRVVVVGDQPLIEPEHLPGGGRHLIFYGRPMATYGIEYATNLTSPDWRRIVQFPLTNVVRHVRNLPATDGAAFYRGVRFESSRPLLEINRDSTGAPILLVYGEAGASYTLQYATNLSAVVEWRDYMTFSLTNSFRYLSNLPGSNAATFLRVKKP